LTLHWGMGRYTGQVGHSQGRFVLTPQRCLVYRFILNMA
jgi:hypothetical protein